jgi:hypothetical protein
LFGRRAIGNGAYGGEVRFAIGHGGTGEPETAGIESVGGRADVRKRFSDPTGRSAFIATMMRLTSSENHISALLFPRRCPST